jgi:putative heme iron utilization protein
MAAKQEAEDYVGQAAALMLAARAGSLATVSPQGAPYAALVTPAVTDDGHVLLLLSDMSAHTRHLRANPACALLLTGAATSENPQTTPRVTLTCEAVLDADPAGRDIFLRFHSYAELYISFTDFNLWRLFPKDAHYVGGFAAAARLEPAALQHEISALRRIL